MPAVYSDLLGASSWTTANIVEVEGDFGKIQGVTKSLKEPVGTKPGAHGEVVVTTYSTGVYNS